jgi:hypothetical protein
MARYWKTFWREKSLRHLLLAVCISFALHLLLIGELKIKLPSWHEDPASLEARLVMLPAKQSLQNEANELRQKPAAKTIAKNTAKQTIKSTPNALPAPVISEQTDTVNSPPPEPAAVQQELAPVTAPDNTQATVPDPEPVLPADDASIAPAVENANLIVNADAYRYVETAFDVRTDPNAQVDSRPEGRAHIVYQLLPNGEQYQLKSLIEPSGLAALVIPDLLQTSEGFMSSMGLQPMNYLYQFGDKQDKTYRARMDWESAKLHLQTSKGNKEVPLTEGTQDLLSFMYQFMFIPPPQNMQLKITNGKKLDSYQYFFAGEETIPSKMGELRTVHIYRDNDDNDERSELWLALDYQYVPVKIRKTEPQNKVYELLATSIKTERPPELKP